MYVNTGWFCSTFDICLVEPPGNIGHLQVGSSGAGFGGGNGANGGTGGTGGSGGSGGTNIARIRKIVEKRPNSKNTFGNSTQWIYSFCPLIDIRFDMIWYMLIHLLIHGSKKCHVNVTRLGQVLVEEEAMVFRSETVFRGHDGIF